MFKSKTNEQGRELQFNQHTNFWKNIVGDDQSIFRLYFKNKKSVCMAKMFDSQPHDSRFGPKCLL